MRDQISAVKWDPTKNLAAPLRWRKPRRVEVAGEMPKSALQMRGRFLTRRSPSCATWST